MNVLIFNSCSTFSAESSQTLPVWATNAFSSGPVSPLVSPTPDCDARVRAICISKGGLSKHQQFLNTSLPLNHQQQHHMQLHLHPELLWLCLGGRSPEAYNSRRMCLSVCVFVCVCVCVCMSFMHISLQRLKTKHWKLQCKCNATISWISIL